MSELPRTQPGISRYVGIDPGWKNLGVATLLETPDGGNLRLFATTTLNPSDCGDPVSFAVTHDHWFELPCHFTVERYVSYEGVRTAEAERICMLIGAIGAVRSVVSRGWESTRPVSETPQVQQLRAIDWKTSLAKLLFKHRNFRNPSKDLDKTFSFAAARACLGLPAETTLGKMKQLTPTKAITDHEADAICLAAFPFFQRLDAQRRFSADKAD